MRCKIFARYYKRGDGGDNSKSASVKGGCLDITCDKVSRFIRFCDAFNILIADLVNGPGYPPGWIRERGSRECDKVRFRV